MLKMRLKLLLFSMLMVMSGGCIESSAQSKRNYKECNSIDIRNDCTRMHVLDGCTVITGFLMITLVQAQAQCNYTAYQYPQLREVTDFVIFTEVRGLISINNMFPNLTVIRGRRLFLNYALGITNMPDLQLLEFGSLVAIQRGHVYIGSCPKLCQVERINWKRLTLTTGENQMILNQDHCTQRVECKGCPSNYCWSNFKCQLFENDNVVPDQNHWKCHPQCLGGCYGTTAADCVVCRGLTDDGGVCVEKCPPNKFLMEQYQRCYTRQQCVSHHGHYTYGFSCVSFCPSGYKADATLNCIPCAPYEACISVCNPEDDSNAIVIYNLAEADELRGCQIINGSLIITIRNQVHEQQLARSLSSIREIRGHLKVYRSSQLTSLQFLRNLQRIHGDPLENRLYALILYDNKQLSELWQPDKELEFVNGGMFMHRNNKLCNRFMKDFQAHVVHDKTLDSLQTSDKEVLCDPAKLQFNIQANSHRMVELSWPKAQTSSELELIYRPMKESKYNMDLSDLSTPVCKRIAWQRRLLFPDELPMNNVTHFSYQLKDLQPHTRYAFLLRTFGDDWQHDARSDLMVLETRADIPQPPQLSMLGKTNNSLTIRVAGADNETSEEQTMHYELAVFELPDDISYLDERDYCKQPAILWQEMDGTPWYIPVEDYDDCCTHQAELEDEREFIDAIRMEYRCSWDNYIHCANATTTTSGTVALPLFTKQLAGNTSIYKITELKRYHSYAIQLQICNAMGCSSYTTINERTNYTIDENPLPDLTACHVPSTDEYIVRFSDPEHPNGVIVSYVIHFRNIVSPTGVRSHLSCITRRAHEEQDFEHVALLNDSSYTECAVRVHSLAGGMMSPYVQIAPCDAMQLITLKPHHRGTSKDMPTTQVNTSHSKGISVFVICFLMGCICTVLWVMYKRRCWRKLPSLRHYVPVREQWLSERHPPEDREILVDGFETVRFHNNGSGGGGGGGTQLIPDQY